jgi:glycosyltransferase involved in cell wall biosynthesis
MPCGLVVTVVFRLDVKQWQLIAFSLVAYEQKLEKGLFTMRFATIHTLYNRRAGAELLAEKTLEAIQEQAPDWQMTIFCNRQAKHALAERFTGPDIRYVPWLDNQFRKTFWLEFIAPRIVTRRHFDLFWLPSGGASFPGPWDVPTVATFLDMGVFLVKGRFDFVRTVYRKHISTPLSIRRAAALTAISRTTAEDVVKLFPKARMPAVVYPGPSPLLQRPAPPDPVDYIAKVTGHAFDRILFAPARTDYLGKARDILLLAYQEYRRRSAKPLPLVLPGPTGKGHDLLMRDIDTLHLQGHVIWPGSADSECMEAFYKISDAMILPSRTEGFGFPIIEAMDRGIPVICSDAGSLPEVAGDAALVVPTGSVGGLLEAMLKLEKQPGLRDELIRKGRERARAFSWEQTARGYIDVFQSTVKANT